MALQLRQSFTQQQLNNYIDQQYQKVEAAILFNLKYVGEAFVRNARNNNTYRDQTGNLRSSIGYVIAKDGVIKEDNFKQSNAGTDKQTGVAKARQLAQDIADEHNSGYVLICVAGMNYAAIVESRGNDVITNSAISAKLDLQKAIQSLNRKLKK